MSTQYSTTPPPLAVQAAGILIAPYLEGNPMSLTALFILAAFAVIASADQRAAAQTLRYPPTRKVDQVDDYYGVKVADPYRWLEDANSPETVRWVEDENSVTFGYLNSLRQRAKIRARLTNLWDYPRYGLPFKEGGRYFYFKNDGLQNQSVLYVRDSLKGEPRLVIDPNKLSADGTVALSASAVSHDGKMLAYATSSGGSDWQDFHVRDIDGGADRADHLTWVKFSGASWTMDNRGFFYSRYPAPPADQALQQVNKFQKVCYHALGDDQSRDRLIYERADEPDWGMGAFVTEDGRYAIIAISVGTDPRNRVYYIKLGDPVKPDLSAPVNKLIDVFEASYSFIGNDGDTFYLRTDRDAPRGKVIAIDLKRPEPDHWRVVVPETQDKLESVDLVGDHLIVTYLHNAYSLVSLYDLKGAHVKDVRLPGIGTVGGLDGKRMDTERFYSFTSYLSPTTIFRYDARTGRSTVFRKPEIAFDPAPYETKQVWCRSKDGTGIPMFITHRKGLKLDGKNPTMLYGYGGFNVSMTPGFSVGRVVWLENGGIYAEPNLRGGGEFGEEWHQAGARERKQNVFDDFIAAAEYLIQEGYTSPAHLAISGASNGGLLVGAAMTQRPDLFACALPAVGVMDMLRFHKFTIGWAWVSDYGSSDDPAQFRALYAYSPLQRLKPGTQYPATLITTGDHDDRVVPAHSFKFAATLQADQAGDRPVLIRIETRAGHGAGKPTAKVIDEAADVWAFAMQHTGMDYSPR